MARRGPAALTGRAILLGLVLCALVASLALPLKEYLGQRGQIGALQQQSADRSAAIEALKQRQGQLADPAYVQAQARARLGYVMPGDTVFRVVHRDGTAPPTTATPMTGADGEVAPDTTAPDTTAPATDAPAAAPTAAPPADGVHAVVPDQTGDSWLARLGESVAHADAG